MLGALRHSVRYILDPGISYSGTLSLNRHVSKSALRKAILGHSDLLAGPRTHINISKEAEIDAKPGSGLHIGKRWEGIYPQSTNLKMASGAKLTVSGNFNFFAGTYISINEDAALELGSGYVNTCCKIDIWSKLEIGNNVLISDFAIIRDSDNHGTDPLQFTKPIVIEDNVWIGIRATILKGVRIGSGSVIAAGAVVTRDVPRGAMVAGVPARVIKEKVVWR